VKTDPKNHSGSRPNFLSFLQSETPRSMPRSGQLGCCHADLVQYPPVSLLLLLEDEIALFFQNV
jgi:hypothetical protein